MKACLLHTTQSHIERFTPLLKAAHKSSEIEQIVEEDLLRAAETSGGLTLEIKQRILSIFDNQIESGVEVILVTCSTLGGIAEEYPNYKGCKILRIDEALAELSIATADNLAIICAVETTLDPTEKLFLETAARLGKYETKVTMHLVPDAWDHFLNGDIHAYESSIAEYITAQCQSAEAIILAQASMSDVEKLLKDENRPILSSPALGIKALLDSCKI